MRSPARGFVRHGRRPHISRIERRRGPVSRYGESARAVLVFEALSGAGLGGRGGWGRFEGAGGVGRLTAWTMRRCGRSGSEGSGEGEAASAPARRRFEGGERIEIGRASRCHDVSQRKGPVTVGQGRRGACGHRSPGTEGGRRGRFVCLGSRRAVGGHAVGWTWRSGRARARGSRLGRPWRESHSDECGGSRRAGRAAGTGG